MKTTPPTTALRGISSRNKDGLVVLVDRESDYRDGSEASLLEKLAAASDLTSTSDELAAMAMTWAERYHLDPSRANVIRALALPAESRVLEVGAGCGAITRYLGETVALVDALEPVASRAIIARARCQDLDNVEVVIGEIGDLPVAADYDVIVVIGVLEYVGSGSHSDEPYLGFLRAIAERLAPGGRLVLAIENKLGVKYLAGAPEDHYNEPFVGVEGYPGKRTLARTFSRDELGRLLQAAGLHSRNLSAFPDYKITRVVMDSEKLIGSECEDLLENLPIFPSPDWTGTREDGADENLLWTSLVRAGLAAQFANSFVVLAGTDAPDSGLWPENRLASYFSWDRKAEFTTVAVVERAADARGVTIARTPLRESHGDSELRLVASSSPYLHGTGLIAELLRSNADRARELIQEWARIVGERHQAGTLNRDLVPSNILVDAAGALVVIDQEWSPDGGDPVAVLRRGAVVTALQLAQAAMRPVWLEESETPSDIAGRLASWAEITDSGWLDRTLDRESELQAIVGRPLGSVKVRRQGLIRTELAAAMAERVRRTPVPFSHPVDSTIPSEIIARIALGAAAMSRLATLETEMAAQLAEQQLQQFAALENLDMHSAMHVANLRNELDAAGADRVRVQAERDAATTDLAASRAELLVVQADREALAIEARAQAGRARSAEDLNDDLRASLSWRATAGLRVIRGAFGRKPQ